MGRLRSGRDARFLMMRAKEVTELFGTSDAILYRFSAVWAENLAGKDPLWGEPSQKPFYKAFPMAIQWFDWTSSDAASEYGLDSEVESTAYISKQICLEAGVPPDQELDYVNAGDVLAIHTSCGHQTLTYDIIECDRDGWIDSSDSFSQYKVALKRRQKFEPERKL